MSDGRRNPPAEELYARKWPIFAVTMIGLFMALIDVTIVNIAIPTLEKDLHASVGSVSWVLNAYNIMFAVLLVSMGRLADQFGRRRFFLIGMSIFTFGSLLCALAPTIHALIGVRVVQAVGAGVLAPLASATTTLVFPPRQRGLGLALMAMVASFAAAIGPPLGGVLIELASWHWIFLINVPIGVLGLLFAVRVMPETYDLTAHRRIDWFGMGLIGAAILCVTYALVEANNRGWSSPLIVSLLVASAVLAAAFVLSQRFGRAPMLTSALARNHQFTGASAAMLLFGAGMMGTLFLAVIMFVNLWDYSELKAAFAILPIPLTGLLVSPLVGRFADRVPPRVIAVPALVALSAGMLTLAGFPTRPHYVSVLPALALVGAGIGATFPAVNVGAMGSITGQELGLGSGIVNMSRQLGYALGVAVLVAVFTGAIKDNFHQAQPKAAAVAEAGGYAGVRRDRLLATTFSGPAEHPGPRVNARNPTERAVAGIAARSTRDAFADGFRVAALAVALALPFSLTMLRQPARVHAPETLAPAD